MENKINIAEIIYLNEYGKYFYSKGDRECLLFPSKEERDWTKFQRPFKDGDILTNTYGNTFIYKGTMYYNKEIADFYCGYRKSDNQLVLKTHKDEHFGHYDNSRFATEEEKELLFQAIKDNGYKWNEETKTLEKLVAPKYKVGDKVKHKVEDSIHTVTDITEECFYLNNCKFGISLNYQDNYELVPNTFDINTLKPFDKVLMRNTDTQRWNISLYGYNNEKIHPYKYSVLNHIQVAQCIPYNEETKHLLGTNNDCPEYYKTW